MDTALDIGKNVFHKYNQLVLQPNIIASPSVYTFTKENMMFVVESGAAGLMGHTHELYEVSNEILDKNVILSFRMARTYLHDHEGTYFIAKNDNDNSYAIYTTRNDKLVNMSTEKVLHAHHLKLREIFKDSVRIFSDYRDVQVISNTEFTFEIQLDESILAEHIHDIEKVNIPDRKKAEVAFIFKDALFHGHSGVFYIKKKNGDFVIKHDKHVVHTTTPDDKIGKHKHNIKLIRVTRRATNTNVLLEDPVPDHAARELVNVAKMLAQLT